MPDGNQIDAFGIRYVVKMSHEGGISARLNEVVLPQYVRLMEIKIQRYKDYFEQVDAQSQNVTSNAKRYRRVGAGSISSCQIPMRERGVIDASQILPRGVRHRDGDDRFTGSGAGRAAV
ncbi:MULTISPECIES: hypothetical protein [unclassified Novosphingobium]|uniref:hypothetical protein n=1 Tax=unclassified Novosphingobium TaxID=2644732 RepID=UPI000FA1D134|nr:MULTISPECIES: hypothetical protein [unclassified Novosphingobium]RQW44327.1 hypothetical protein EH199_08850 [Novosphingobium sp. LASN5T]